MKPKLPVAVLLAAALGAAVPSIGESAVVIVANRTDRPVRFTVQPLQGKAEEHVLESGDLLPVPFADGAELSLTSAGKRTRYLLEPNGVYFFAGTPGSPTLEQIGIGDKPAKPTAPAPSPLLKKVTIPVKILVDDDEPAARKVWEQRLRRRLQAASDIIERHCRARFEVVAVETWESDNRLTDFNESLKEFAHKVKPDRARLVIGFTSQFPNPGGPSHLGVIRSILHTHILVREWFPRSEPERLEVLVHELGHFLGAAHSPETETVMRPKLGDGQARTNDFPIRFDPLNALAMCLVAEEIQARGVKSLGELRPGAREPLGRVYAELARALPDDPATNELARVMAQPAAAAKEGSAVPAALVDSTRHVVAAVVRAAGRNQRLPARGTGGAGPFRVTGDPLTESYIREAAAAARELPLKHAAPAFLLGIGIALDSSDLLRKHPTTRALFTAVESDEEHRRRLEVLGVPTLRGRHDLAQHFVLSSALTVLAGPAPAEAAGLLKEQLDMQPGGSGLSFADLAANLAGIAFAERLLASPERIGRLAEAFALGDYAPDMTGLREGLSQEAFARDFGSLTDERFRAEVAAVRKRVLALPGHRNTSPGK